MHFMHGYGSIWPLIVMVIFWGGLIITGLYLASSYVKGGREKDSLQKTLKDRLAKGEIDEEEYEKLKSLLKN